MKVMFSFDAGKCSACGACSVACMDQNDIAAEQGQKPYRRVYEKETADGVLASLSVACVHCTDAPCMSACRLGVLFQDEATGLVCYDGAKCVGCRLCAAACPFDAITFRPTGLTRPRERMEKCQGCGGRIAAGLNPACVNACPTGALTWSWVADDAPNPGAELCRRWLKKTD